MKAMIYESEVGAFADGRQNWHGKFMCNMVFVDGHVTLLKFAPFSKFGYTPGMSWHSGQTGLFDF